jgi:hypothetical protein
MICGSSDRRHMAALARRLDTLHRSKGVDCVMHGGKAGADSLPGRWARQNGVLELVFPAQWDLLGPRAGRIRNQQMVAAGMPDGAVVFAGGPDTADAVRRARDAGLRIWRL